MTNTTVKYTYHFSDRVNQELTLEPLGDNHFLIGGDELERKITERWLERFPYWYIKSEEGVVTND